MVFLREHKLVYMFLSFHLALAMIDEAQSDVTPDRGAPGIGFFLSQRQFGIYIVEIAYGELMNVITEIKFFPSTEIKKKNYCISFSLDSSILLKRYEITGNIALITWAKVYYNIYIYRKEKKEKIFTNLGRSRCCPPSPSFSSFIV